MARNWADLTDMGNPKEAELLHLISDKAYQELGWEAKLDFKETIKFTINWYKNKIAGLSQLELTIDDIRNYQKFNSNYFKVIS